jgi:hypothetical protein
MKYGPIIMTSRSWDKEGVLTDLCLTLYNRQKLGHFPLGLKSVSNVHISPIPIKSVGSLQRLLWNLLSSEI